MGGRAEGLYWIGEMGERRGFSPLFLFSVRWLGVGAMNDDFSIGIVFDLGKRKERKRIN